MKLMGRYINKDALMAEINKLKDKAYPNSDWNHGYVTSCEKILSFINTIEVKDVDLEKELSQWWKSERAKDYNVDILYEKYSNASMKLAKHFYELGLNAQMKTSLREKDDWKNT